MMDYMFVIAPLSEEDGGGYVAYVPDLPGCMSDGDTPEQAALNVQAAVEEWLDCAADRKMEIPPPGSRVAEAAGEHRRLSEAYRELVSDLESMRANVDHLDARLCEVERKIADLDEKIENNHAWSRFEQLIGRQEREEGEVAHVC